jgi:hypothetical protein
VDSARYVYAIVGCDTPLPASIAYGPSDLEMVSCGELAAVTRRVPAGDSVPVTVEAVLHHEAVVEAMRQYGRTLPVRFGTVFREATAVAAALMERYETLAADLDRLGDKVELSLTALWAAPASENGGTPEETSRAGKSAGAQYLYARAAQLRRDETLKERARAVAEELDRALGEVAVLEQRVTLAPTPRVAIRTTYLLDSAEVDAFQVAFEGVRRSRDDVRVLLTGPWPPYSFVKQNAALSSCCD